MSAALAVPTVLPVGLTVLPDSVHEAQPNPCIFNGQSYIANDDSDELEDEINRDSENIGSL